MIGKSMTTFGLPKGLGLMLGLVLVYGLLAGCSAPATEAPAANTPAAAATTPAESAPAANTPAAAAPATEATLNIQNDSNEEICDIFFSKSTDEEWGDDHLALLDLEKVEPGESKSFTVESGTYDIRLQDCTRSLQQQENEVAIDPSYTLSYAGRGPTDSVLTVANETSESICRVFFSLPSDEFWGNDQLGVQEMIDPGTRREFNIQGQTYDILLTDCEGNLLLEELGVEISGAYTLNYNE